jgi:hypothetical protein
MISRLVLLIFCALLLLIVVAIILRKQRQRRSSTIAATNDAIAMVDLPIDSKVSTIHLIVLVHGYMGLSVEMDSLKQSLQAHMAGSSDDSCLFVVHSATCNENRTFDGVAAGGSRLAQEINQIVQRLQTIPNDDNQQKQTQKCGAPTITLSLVGNSLGGLYARYALGEIDFPTTSLVPKLFVTTATPHLGVGQNTYLKLPRAVEYPLASAMQQTGLDMFSFSNILKEMTLEDKFVRPLLKFEHRIAYANVHGTDFQVPAATAAFWEESSDSEHFLVDVTNNADDYTETATKSLHFLQPNSENSPFQNNNVVAVYETRENPSIFDDGNNEGSLSKYLDAMGWTKVLVDVRPHLPSWSNRNNKQTPSRQPSAEERVLKKATTVASARQLLEQYGGGNFLTVPLGHPVISANAKDAFHRWLTQGGRPLMDSLAGSMVEYLSSSSLEEPPEWPKAQAIKE